MSLGTVADLPTEYYDGLVSRNLLPLWPSLRAVLPYGKPSRKTQPVLWKYADIRPNLLRAGELAPIEKAERRVLVLCNPGLGLENMQATPSIYIGLQLIQPGETAPNHLHSPSAVRFVVEGDLSAVDGYVTVVEPGRKAVLFDVDGTLTLNGVDVQLLVDSGALRAPDGSDLLESIRGTRAFRHVPVLSDEPADSDWQGARGFAHEAAVELFGNDFRGHKAYLCGPPLMIDACITALMQGRLFERDIYQELFISAADTARVRSPLFKKI